MIITCPSCATRYDVDDDRFSPDGRSVRCAECDESWFVPAAQPIENLMPAKAKGGRKSEAEPPRSAAKKAGRRDDAYEEGVDEPLFEAPKSPRFRMAEETRGKRPAPEDAEAGPRRARGSPPPPDGEEDGRRDYRGERRTEADPDDDAGLRAMRDRREAKVVDADFEDVGRASFEDDDAAGRGFGRRMRDDRRRETALARIEDLEPIAERVFNDEFFAALRVQPKELERAIRKARRRAEARDKNRLTPLNAIGWSAWVGAVAACAFVAYSYRNNIVAMFPNAAGAYEAVGIDASPYGLKIEGVTHRVAMSADGPVIEILGRLRNAEAADVTPPMLQAEALGGGGEILSRWTFAPQAEKVRAGEAVDFSTRAPAPEGVSEVLLSFAPAEGVKVSVGGLLKPQSN